MGVKGLRWIWRTLYRLTGLQVGEEGLRWVLKALVGMEGLTWV